MQNEHNFWTVTGRPNSTVGELTFGPFATREDALSFRDTDGEPDWRIEWLVDPTGLVAVHEEEKHAARQGLEELDAAGVAAVLGLISQLQSTPKPAPYLSYITIHASPAGTAPSVHRSRALPAGLPDIYLEVEAPLGLGLEETREALFAKVRAQVVSSFVGASHAQMTQALGVASGLAMELAEQFATYLLPVDPQVWVEPNLQPEDLGHRYPGTGHRLAAVGGVR